MPGIIFTTAYKSPHNWEAKVASHKRGGASSRRDVVSYIGNKTKDIEKSEYEPVLTLDNDDTNFEGLKDINEYDFVKYLTNEKKAIQDSGSFDLYNLKLSDEEIALKKKAFNESQENGSHLWLGVFSFTDEFLEENLIKAGKNIRTDLLNQYGQIATLEFVEKNNLDLENVNVMCAFHYNTEHIHMHMAVCEKEPTKSRGKIAGETIKATKSKMANQIDNNNTDYYKRIDILKKQIKNNFSLTEDLEPLYDSVRDSLPREGRISYNSKNLSSNTKKNLDLMIDSILSEDEDYIEFEKEIKFYNDKVARDKYGGENNDYFENKKKDLYTEIGNTIIKEMIKENINIEKEINEADEEHSTSKKNKKVTKENPYINNEKNKASKEEDDDDKENFKIRRSLKKKPESYNQRNGIKKSIPIVNTNAKYLRYLLKKNKYKEKKAEAENAETEME